jgi:hypothetical protein
LNYLLAECIILGWQIFALGVLTLAFKILDPGEQAETADVRITAVILVAIYSWAKSVLMTYLCFVVLQPCIWNWAYSSWLLCDSSVRTHASCQWRKILITFLYNVTIPLLYKNNPRAQIAKMLI